jgi:hypothetical protein
MAQSEMLSPSHSADCYLFFDLSHYRLVADSLLQGSNLGDAFGAVARDQKYLIMVFLYEHPSGL